MEKDNLVERRDYGGSPPHVEYALTARGRLLLPIVESLRRLGETLGCNECEDRREHLGDYCDACPHRRERSSAALRREHDDSIVLL
jgi:DNA-binding HxlR family transcriptional regulator